jgi:3',5'-cyclic-AMP phosphodiesterase
MTEFSPSTLSSLSQKLLDCSPAESLRVVQITDTHLFADADGELLGMKTADSFYAIAAQLKQLDPCPHLILLTGDLSQDETSGSYKRLLQGLAPLEIPVYWLPGNHDQRLWTMQSTLNPTWEGPEVSCSAGAWQIILLNCLVNGKVYGELSSTELQRLEHELQQTAPRPTLIALHHPPVPTGSAWMDNISLKNSEEFLAIIDQHPQVKLVVFGHIHQEFSLELQGVTYLSGPSTCIQFQPNSPKFAIDDRYPGFRCLTLNPNGSFTTQVERVEFSCQIDRMAREY